MSAPRDLGPDFRSWMQETPAMPPELPTRTLDETRHTRQRRRWLWFLPGPMPTAGADDQGSEQTQWPAIETKTRGLSPADTGGTPTMLSATRVVGLAAIAALVGSVMLVAGPPSIEQLPQAPAAVVDGPTELTAVHGTMEIATDGHPLAIEQRDWGAATVDWLIEFEFDVDEPRLRGDGRMRMNEYNVKGLSRGPTAASFYVQNEAGSWTGESLGYRGPDQAGYHFQVELTGHGGYDGLTAILTGSQAFYGDDVEISGMVVDGSLPPMPAPAEE